MIWLFGILSVASSCSPDASGKQWTFDASSHPAKATLLRTTFTDPDFKDYVPKPLHTYDAGGLTAEEILDWYQENMATGGWAPWARDDHQVIFVRRASRPIHTLRVTMSGNWDQLGDSAVDEYTVEESEAEL